ncbi:MAG: UDP-N-acetylmuramoyl-L-alanyl-D-glutamate--2,6-diaminopimelate ligase [Betaproteobacteria bacterium]
MNAPWLTDALAWLRQHAPAARDLHLDSRQVAAGDVFVALPGARVDGRDYIAAAVARGAAAAVVEAQGWRGEAACPVLPLPHLAARAGELAAAFYGAPSAALRMFGVTGTNGKTSCSQWIAQLLTASGTRCAAIGTVGSGFPGREWRDAALTTPDAVSLQRELHRLRAAGAQAVAMEVSSIGLDQGRVAGTHFDVALFTNLTRDHLDYHGTMAAYEAAKTRLFDWPGLRCAVLNLDDAMGRRLAARGGGEVIGYGAAGAGDAPVAWRVQASEVAATARGLAFTVEAAGRRARIDVPLVGQFNVANLLGVLGCALAAGVDFEAACRQLPKLVPPPGRMQRVGGVEEPLAVIDYAHTPDALAQALAALRPAARARGGALWVVFGAGGDRDPGKRAPMGEAAARGADRVVITSDNPRSEVPDEIVTAVAAGARGARQLECIVDRAEAIAHALAEAAPADIVLIAGKGHEPYQEIGGRRLPFSDLEHARAALDARRVPA